MKFGLGQPFFYVSSELNEELINILRNENYTPFIKGSAKSARFFRQKLNDNETVFPRANLRFFFYGNQKKGSCQALDNCRKKKL